MRAYKKPPRLHSLPWTADAWTPEQQQMGPTHDLPGVPHGTRLLLSQKHKSVGSRGNEHEFFCLIHCQMPKKNITLLLGVLDGSFLPPQQHFWGIQHWNIMRKKHFGGSTTIPCWNHATTEKFSGEKQRGRSNLLNNLKTGKSSVCTFSQDHGNCCINEIFFLWWLRWNIWNEMAWSKMGGKLG